MLDENYAYVDHAIWELLLYKGKNIILTSIFSIHPFFSIIDLLLVLYRSIVDFNDL